MGVDLSRYTDYYTNPLSTKPSLNEEEARVVPWFMRNGDKALRYDYALNKNSIVYDMGGYEGEWAGKIYDKYGCTVEVFEPVIKFAEAIEKKFAGKSKIHTRYFGLGKSNHIEKINLDLASSSSFKKGSKTESIEIVRAREFIAKQPKKDIDLIKINIEGGEYGLLDDLIDSGLIKRFHNLQIQFHIFVPNARAKRLKLQEQLSKTHEMTFNYPFIWENWRLKK